MAFDAMAFLDYWGFERIKDHNEENVMASCFRSEYHSNDDRKRSFGIRKDTGVANCYVCGGWSLEQLTRELLNRRAEAQGSTKRYNDYDALMWLEQKGWLPEQFDIDELRKEFEGMEGFEFKDVIVREETYYDESILQPYLTGIHKKALQRGSTPNAISLETARQFQLGYDRQTKRIIIPVRNEKGLLVGVISRAAYDDDFIRYGVGTVNPEWLLAQWQNRPYVGESMLYTFDKRYYVFGEHLWNPKNRGILVIESPLDVVYAFSQGLNESMNIGAIFGSKPTKEQMEKILRHEYVIEGLDNDTPGKEGKEKFYQMAEGRCQLYTFDSFGKKDLGECTPLEVQSAPARFKPYESKLFNGLQFQTD